MSENHSSKENGIPLGSVNSVQNFRLLFPGDDFSEGQEPVNELSPGAWRDLGLDNIVTAFSTNREYQTEITTILSALIQDPDVIRYRQDIIEDLLNNPSLVNRIEILLPIIDSLTLYPFGAGQELDTLYEVAWRVGEIQNIIDCIQGLADILQDVRGKLNSKGLISLDDELQKMIHNPTYQTLVRELPGLLSNIRTCASVTIGINLDASLRPIQATLLSVNDKPFTGHSLLNKLFGIKKDGEGIAPLHSVPHRPDKGPVAFPYEYDLGWAVDPMMVPLFADLSRILKKTARPIVNQLAQYSELQGSLFLKIRQDLIFYLGVVKFIQRLRDQGLPVCRPEILPINSRICEVQDSYNVNLALRHVNKNGEQNIHAAIIKNDIHIGPKGRVLILTGPNQGGKTTYMQGVGLVQVLAQLGCFVPGEQAQISILENIFTHFPLEEKPDLEMGRLGEEATRMSQIFQHVTQNNLVLLNESLSSTSSGESIYLAQDIVKALRQVGACAIYSTHLHDLADKAQEINDSVTGDSMVISVVSSPVDLRQSTSEGGVSRTYKIEIRPPLCQSYAKEIAEHYGISFEQLVQVLIQRGVL